MSKCVQQILSKSTWTRLLKRQQQQKRLQQPTRRHQYISSSDTLLTVNNNNSSLPRLQLSTVHQGNAFEERSLAILHKTMSMSLKRVGGKEDGGVDLIGWWWLPTSDDPSPSPSSSQSPLLDTSVSSKGSRIRVIGQCKAEKKKTGPKYVRELEGVLSRLVLTTTTTTTKSSSSSSSLDIMTPPEKNPPDPNNNNPQFPIIALLISQSEFTKSAILRANSSPIPFLLIHLPAIDNPEALIQGDDDDDGADGGDPFGDLGMILSNPALSGADGLLKGQMEIRWERFEFGGGGRPSLWWGDRKLGSWTPELEQRLKPRGI